MLKRSILLLLFLSVLVGCGGPSRTDYAKIPSEEDLPPASFMKFTAVNDGVQYPFTLGRKHTDLAKSVKDCKVNKYSELNFCESDIDDRYAQIAFDNDVVVKVFKSIRLKNNIIDDTQNALDKYGLTLSDFKVDHNGYVVAYFDGAFIQLRKFNSILGSKVAFKFDSFVEAPAFLTGNPSGFGHTTFDYSYGQKLSDYDLMFLDCKTNPLSLKKEVNVCGVQDKEYGDFTLVVIDNVVHTIKSFKKSVSKGPLKKISEYFFSQVGGREQVIETNIDDDIIFFESTMLNGSATLFLIKKISKNRHSIQVINSSVQHIDRAIRNLNKYGEFEV
ncbi:hypothetical protein [uncultured Alteromonas sp.]|jgi:hypothetical protein|uniref:hypothetical protein n=1 Tax=uncultured Alteromonas sp. TaxID=179113 RepID=UPI0030CE1E20|tara:strand:+ start:31788 stop:32780 length:993 start_codon:yes stop_codon:yes gene_type:complete